MKIYIKSLKSIFLAISIFASFIGAQSVEDDQDSGFVLEILTLPSSMCDDYLSSKGYTNGLNTLRSGKEVFFSVGFSSVKAPKSSPMYIDSIQNAFTTASLQAKKELAEYWGKKITNDLKASMKEKYSE